MLGTIELSLFLLNPMVANKQGARTQSSDHMAQLQSSKPRHGRFMLKQHGETVAWKMQRAAPETDPSEGGRSKLQW